MSIMATTKRPRTKKTVEAPAATESTTTKETPAKAKASVSKQVATVTTRTLDLQEAIRLRAYEYFQQRGYQHGADFEDWIRAEKEVHERFNAA